MIEEQRIAEQAIALSEGDVHGVATWLCQLGCTDRTDVTDSMVSVCGVTGIRVGLAAGVDPINCAAQLILALYGPMGFLAGQDVFSAVDREWTRRRAAQHLTTTLG